MTEMTKKDYILALLTKLSGQWDYADGLKAVVEQATVEASVMDGLYMLLSQAVSDTVDSIKKKALNT